MELFVSGEQLDRNRRGRKGLVECFDPRRGAADGGGGAQGRGEGQQGENKTRV
jgi:hypothetical protein